MTKRLVMTPAVGLFAGLSVFSYGAVNMLLSGVHETRQAATSPCSAAAPMIPAPTHTSTTRTLPGTRTASHVSGPAPHPAGMPVLPAHPVRHAPGGQPWPDARGVAPRAPGPPPAPPEPAAEQPPNPRHKPAGPAAAKPCPAGLARHLAAAARTRAEPQREEPHPGWDGQVAG